MPSLTSISLTTVIMAPGRGGAPTAAIVLRRFVHRYFEHRRDGMSDRGIIHAWEQSSPDIAIGDDPLSHRLRPVLIEPGRRWVRRSTPSVHSGDNEAVRNVELAQRIKRYVISGDFLSRHPCISQIWPHGRVRDHKLTRCGDYQPAARVIVEIGS
jgi:hypothetical protein